MNHTTQQRLVSDEEIRAHYIRTRSIREACSAIGYYGRKLDLEGIRDESYFVPISKSFRKSMDLGLDHLRVHASALALAYHAPNEADRHTYYLAAEELNRILDAYDKQKGNYSQKQHAASIRKNPHGIESILRDVTQDEGVVNFWKDHVRQQTTGKLSANCTIELQECIENHFASKLSIKDMFTKDTGFEGPQRY